MSHETQGANMSNPTAQMVTGPAYEEDEVVGDRHAITEIIVCLIKYQARYHDAPHARRLWKRADKALKAFAQSKTS